MKRTLLFLTAMSIVSLFVLASCTQSDKDVEVQTPPVQIGEIHGSRVHFRDLDELIEWTRGFEMGFNPVPLSKNIIRAEVLDSRVEYQELFGDGLFYIVSQNRIRILEVFYGKVEVGDILDVGQFEPASGPEFGFEVGDDLILFVITEEDGTSGMLSSIQGTFRTPGQLAHSQTVMDAALSRTISDDVIFEGVHPRNDLVLTLADLMRIQYESQPSQPQ